MGGQRHDPATLPQERPGTHCIGSWVGHWADLDGSEKFAPTGIRSPDRPARSESLLRLSYPGHYKQTLFFLALVYVFIIEMS